MGVRLLLLGCSGFVGRELVPHLLELGHEITLVSRRSPPLPGPGRSQAIPATRSERRSPKTSVPTHPQR